MKHRVCPWWLGYWLLNPLRRWRQDPRVILAPYVHEGMTVLEPGPGMGFFTLDLAHLVGPSGRVVAVDVQPRMINKLKRRLAKAGVDGRADVRVASADSMGLSDLKGAVDFTAAFYVVHEFPNHERFFSEVAEVSKSGAGLLVAEPKGHVSGTAFEAELDAAAKAGFGVVGRPEIRRSHAAAMRKQ
ncbi:MAG TPA: methyltransferase domain-containing protein [Candidatus Eisenbacteria bacterium]|nr:methyltransferase domain-containing protein [Candidatus Eisenbacteria bacterium]